MVVPVYIAEASPSDIRGSLASLQQFLITVGILLSYLINYLLSGAEAWRLMLGLGVVPAATVGVAFINQMVGVNADLLRPDDT